MKISNKKSYNKKSYKKKSYNKKSYNKKSYNKKSYNKKSYNKKSYNKKSYKIGGGLCHNIMTTDFDNNIKSLEEETKNSNHSQKYVYFAIVKNPYVMSKGTFYKNLNSIVDYKDIDTSPDNVFIYCLTNEQLYDARTYVRSSNNRRSRSSRIRIENKRVNGNKFIDIYDLLLYTTGLHGYIIDDIKIHPNIKKFNIFVKVEEDSVAGMVNFYHLIKSSYDIPSKYIETPLQTENINEINRINAENRVEVEGIKAGNEAEIEKIKEENRVEIEEIKAESKEEIEKTRKETRAEIKEIREEEKARQAAEEIEKATAERLRQPLLLT
jgi:hypothetical protein